MDSCPAWMSSDPRERSQFAQREPPAGWYQRRKEDTTCRPGRHRGVSGVVSIPLSRWQRSSASYTSHLFSPVAISYRRYCSTAGEHCQRATCADERAGVAAPTAVTADATRSAAGQHKHGNEAVWKLSPAAAEMPLAVASPIWTAPLAGNGAPVPPRSSHRQSAPPLIGRWPPRVPPLLEGAGDSRTRQPARCVRRRRPPPSEAWTSSLPQSETAIARRCRPACRRGPGLSSP